MSQKNKLSVPSSRIWQRHTLAKACALALAGAGLVANAQTVPGAALLTTFGTVDVVQQMSGTYWSLGYNSQWVNSQTQSGSIMAPINSTVIGSSLTGSGGSYPVAITGNSILASVLGNQGSSSLTTLNRVSGTNDGVLSLNLQIFTGLVDTAPTPDVYLAASAASAELDNSSLSLGTVYIKQSGLDSANLNLSNNTMGASVTLNSLDASVAVATPAGYASTSKGSSTLAFDSDSNAMGVPAAPTSGSTGSINLSNQQGAFNAAATAKVKSVTGNVTVAGTAATASATPTLTSSISANGNSISASTANNAAVSVFRSTADSAAFTGSAGVTNLQSTNIVDVTAQQLAEVTGSGVHVDLRNGEGSTAVGGSVTVGNNTVSALVSGNTAGSQSSSGSIAAGNALIFEGASNITGVNTNRATDLTASVNASSSTAEADLFINSVQRNSGNSFTASLGKYLDSTSGVSSQLDALIAGGNLSQSGNSLRSTATNNLAGNLISAGQTTSVGSIAASSVLLNTQNNNAATTLSEVQDGTITASAASSDGGVLTLGSNSIQATAQGNLAGNVIALKADQLTVGDNVSGNGLALTASNPSSPSAASGLAVSALNLQTNYGTSLTALNQGGSLAMTIGDATDTRATVVGNQMTANVNGNSAANQVTLQSANATGLNAGVGSLQINKNSSTTATAGSNLSALAVSLTTGTSSASQVTLNDNTISAQAQLNNAGNTLSVANTSSSGVVGTLGYADTGDLASANAKTDLALVNAQLNNASEASASSYGEIASTTGTLGSGSVLQTGNNQVTGLAEGNSAVNRLTLNNGSMSQASAALVSNQRGTSTDISSLSLGAVTSTTAAVSGASTVSMRENAIKSTAASNLADNTLSATVANAVGVTSATSPALSFNSTESVARADLVLSSQQKTELSDVTARAGSSTDAAQVALTATGVTGSSSLTLSTNEISAAAYANNVSNAASLNIDTSKTIASALISTQQVLDGSLTSATYGNAALTVSSAAASNLAANANAITSTARANTADNSLKFTSTTASGRSTAASFEVANVAISADNALSNVQTNNNNPVSATTVGNVTLTKKVATTGNVSSGASVSFSDNTVSAYGSSNFANNQMTLAVNNLSKATSALVSVQSSEQDPAGSAVSATTTGGVSMGLGLVSDSSLVMNGNTIKSTALDNVASNQLSLTGSTATGTAGLTMTGLISPLSSSGPVVLSDVSLVNLQTSTGGALQASTGADSPVAISLGIAGLNTGGSVTVKDNSITSLVFANNVANTLGLSVSNMSDMTSALSNSQKVDAGTLTAVTAGDVSFASTVAVNAASVTLGNNSVASTAVANESANKLSVNSTDVVGRDLSDRIANAGTLNVVTDFALGNEQQIVSGTTVGANTVANIRMDLTDQAVGASSLALSGNSLSAYGSANNANNQLSMTATNISSSSLGLASSQAMDANSKVESTVAGKIQMTTGAATDANLSATGNSINSTALVNVAGNTLNVTASSYAGPTALEGVVQTQAGSTATSSTADIAIASVQKNTSTEAISATTTGKVEMVVGDLTRDAGTSSASLTGNSLKALAQSNSVSNDIKLNITQFGGATAGLASYQDSAAAVTAALSPSMGESLFAVTASGDLTGTSVAVTGNMASALAGINEAFNSLTVSGANLLGRKDTVSASTEGVASSSGADFAVVNAQAASTSAQANVSLGSSGFSAGGVMNGGNVAVTGNAVLARASANNAANTLTLSAANRLEASGVVNNVQTMADTTTVNASVGSGSAIGAELASSAGSGVVTVKDNTVTAQATGNVASNALNAEASTGITAAGSGTNPTFAVLNYQSTGASGTANANIQASIGGQTLGSSQLGGALNGGSFSSGGNQLTSVAYGNSANNTVMVSALAPGLSTASASITSVQYNMASVKADVSGTSVVANGAVGATGGSVTATGNSIVATAVGNRSINVITGR